MAGVNRCRKFSLQFRTDVFIALFNGKGKSPTRGRGQLYDLEDFDPQFFHAEWYKCYNKLGNGCVIEFPVQLATRIKWSPMAYCKSHDGALAPKGRSFSEIVTVTLVKKRC